MLIRVYRNIVPLRIRQAMYDLVVGDLVFFFRHFSIIVKAKSRYWLGFLFPTSDENRVLAFIGRHGITSYPYPYMLEYRDKKVEVLRDPETGLPFVVHNGRRLFFPRDYDKAKVARDYIALIIEQDARAAHRYVRSYDEVTDKTLLDVGAAEGIFSLDTIQLTKKTILFECLENWQEALQATFAPWREKVTIVKKFVGEKSAGEFVSLDDYVQTPDDLFIKMDIEGAERMALRGAADILQKGRNQQVAVCTYHRPGDPEWMQQLLAGFGFETEFSEGLMYWNKRLSKGVLRAKKS